MQRLRTLLNDLNKSTGISRSDNDTYAFKSSRNSIHRWAGQRAALSETTKLHVMNTIKKQPEWVLWTAITVFFTATLITLYSCGAIN